ncbi:MAG: VTT domain-containing protein [Anaerolineales bacterium]
MSQAAARPDVRGRFLRAAALAAVVALTIFLLRLGPEARRFAEYGYPGIFLVSLLSNATVILPAPGLALTFSMGAVFHPAGVALASATGAAIGELSGYVAGFSGQGVLARTQIYERVEGWTRRYGAWVILFLAVIPSPLFDLAGAAAGALKMPVLRFLAFCWVGKLIKMAIVAYAGAASIDWLARLFAGAP